MNTMPTWLEILLGVVGGLVLLWGALVIALVIQYRRAGRRLDWREIARLVPDVVRLVKRLATDQGVPRATRWWLSGLLVYLIIPIDLVPDFIPVLGYLDDLILVPMGIALALRMIPAPVMLEYRVRAREVMAQGKPVNKAAAVAIVAIWLLLAALSIVLLARLFGH